MRTVVRAHSRRVQVVLLAAALAAAAAGLYGAVFAASAGTAASNDLVVSEVYGGGGNAGATLKRDFIEIANRGTTTVNLDGWTVQYHASGATGGWQATQLAGSIGPGELYLVGEATGSGGTTDLPEPSQPGSIAMAAGSGTVALVHGTAPLTCTGNADSTNCSNVATIVDLVGYGTAAIRETAPIGGPPSGSAALTNAQSASRTSAADSDDNSHDFTVGDPGPQNTANGNVSADPGTTRIHDIQGTTWTSPHDDEHVTNVPGVVTAVRSQGSSRGYWIQDPAPDADPTTSEGIFVFTSSSPSVAVGDDVLVSGNVNDFYPLASGETTSSTSNLSVTEIGGATAIVLSHGNALPAPEVITPSTVPSTYAPDLGGGSIEPTGIHPTRSALDFWESREGMRVEVDDARVVGPGNEFGEQFVTTKPAQNVTTGGGTSILAPNAIPSGRVGVFPVASVDTNPGWNVGDVLGGATIGPVDYSRFGGYVIAATTVGTLRPVANPKDVARSQSSKQLAVATYNVENLRPTDPDSKFQALAHGIVTNLARPDIVALEEVQDDSGATDDGIVAAGQTLSKLVSAITAAGGPQYQWRSIDPVDDQDGGEPGGNIRVAFLYNPARVSFVSRGSSSVNRSITGTEVSGGRGHGRDRDNGRDHGRDGDHGGDVGLTLSPGRIDPVNPVWSTSRKPLAGEFQFRGKTVFVIANHFNSKGGDQSADGRFQFPFQSSAVQRAGQAQVLHDFVEQILESDDDADVVVLGDLNDYQFSPTLSSLTTGSASGSGDRILTDLIDTLPANRRYTYVFNGVSQVLDHILVTDAFKDVEYEVVHINAEYADQTSDHDPQVVRVEP